MKNKELYYFLFSYCFIVKGKEMNIIFNAQKKEVTYIPNCVLNLIELFDTNNIGQIYQYYDNQKNELDGIISFLKNRGLIGLRRKNEVFPPIEIEYDTPELIKHMVVEYSNKYPFVHLCQIINSLLTKFIEIRYVDNFSVISLDQINGEMELLSKTTIKSAQIIIDYQYSRQLCLLNDQENFKIISSIIFFNSPYDYEIKWNNKNVYYVKSNYSRILYSENKYNKNFIFDLHYFILSHLYNPYYYKRLCIDKDGYLMNCLKNRKHFGNILNDDIQEIIQQEDFRCLWHASHDKITNIKDSPLRYNMYITNDLKINTDGTFTII